MELTWSSPSKKIYLDANIFLNVWYKEMMQLGKIYDSSKKIITVDISRYCVFEFYVGFLVFCLFVLEGCYA